MSAAKTFTAAYISIRMKYMDQFVNQNVNLVLIGQHSYRLQLSLTVALAKAIHCQYYIFLARPQSSCTN